MDADQSLTPALVALLIAALGAAAAVLAVMVVQARRNFRRLKARKEDLKLALVERSASLREAVDQAEQANRRIKDLERFDGLTGLANQTSFLEAVDVEWRRGRREKMPLGVLFVAVDAFADFDRALGSGKGDDCLRRVAAVLSTGLFRAGDVVGRWSGERFAILLPWTGLEGGAFVARRLAADVTALAIPHPRSSRGIVSISTGVGAVIPGKGSVDALLASAEAALEEALRRGGGQIVASTRWPAEVPVEV